MLNFDTFINIITKINNNNLLGLSAHEKMLPMDRIKDLSLLNKNIENAKKAAVLALFIPVNNLPYLILIKRNSYEGVHSAQMAFPGGKPEINDTNLEHTALRETAEEIGITSEKITIINQLSNVYIQPSNFLVTPFLGYCKTECEYKLDYNEVQAIFEISLETLMNEKNVILHEVQTSYSKNKLEVPAFIFQNEIVWGATAMMIAEIKEILKIKLKS